MVDPDNSAKYILTSGGDTSEVNEGGIAVVMRHGKLWVEVRLRETFEKWIVRRIPVR